MSNKILRVVKFIQQAHVMRANAIKSLSIFENNSKENDTVDTQLDV